MGKPGFNGLSAAMTLVRDLLSGHVITTKAIMDHFDIKEAAARRHLKRLAALPHVVKDRRRGIKLPLLMQGKPTVSLDVVAACLVSSLGTTLRDTSIKPHLEKVRDAIVARSSDYSDAKDLERKFWFVARGGERAFPHEVDAFLQIADAILHSKKISFSYVGFEGEKKKVVNGRALTLALYEHQFYVIVEREDGGYHPYRFARISKVRVGPTFQYPSRGAYDPAVLFRDTFGIYVASTSPVEAVRIRLTSHWRHYVESHRWHESQHHVVNADGSVDVHINVRIDEELKRWVLWFGSHAEVITPISLRETIAKQLAEAASQYLQRRPGVATTRHSRTTSKARRAD